MNSKISSRSTSPSSDSLSLEENISSSTENSPHSLSADHHEHHGWSSKVTSFIGSFFRQKKAATTFPLQFITEVPPRKTIFQSSSEEIEVSNSSIPTLSFDDFNSLSRSSLKQSKKLLPKEGSLQASAQVRSNFAQLLEKKNQQLNDSSDPKYTLKADINRICYLLHGEKVEDIAVLEKFFGAAAPSILPILCQTIPNTATDVILKNILDDAPEGTIHAEIAASRQAEGIVTMIHIDQEEGGNCFKISIESKGSTDVLLQKVTIGKQADLEMISLHQENDNPIAGTVEQSILLELTPTENQTNSSSYSLSCSKLERKYHLSHCEYSQIT